jgi:prepilin-type N-terminal cleavage/methylation domain-containing protein
MILPAKSYPRHSSRAGFSLIEMIGVLAIIAILAVVIVPKVFSTIASSRVTSAVAGTNAIKIAVSDFAAKYGTIPIANATLRIDDLLAHPTVSLLDNRFSAKIGNPPSGAAGGTWALVGGSWVGTVGGTNQSVAPIQSRVICATSTLALPNVANGANYRLNGGVIDLPAGSRVVSVVIAGVTANEALELSQRVDGDVFSEPDNTTADARGKVVYPVGAGVKNVYIYVAHQ